MSCFILKFLFTKTSWKRFSVRHFIFKFPIFSNVRSSKNPPCARPLSDEFRDCELFLPPSSTVLSWGMSRDRTRRMVRLIHLLTLECLLQVFRIRILSTCSIVFEFCFIVHRLSSMLESTGCRALFLLEIFVPKGLVEKRRRMHDWVEKTIVWWSIHTWKPYPWLKAKCLLVHRFLSRQQVFIWQRDRRGRRLKTGKKREHGHRLIVDSSKPKRRPKREGRPASRGKLL